MRKIIVNKNISSERTWEFEDDRLVKLEIVFFEKVEQEDDMIFVCFKDGSRCNEQLICPINSTDLGICLMAEIDHPSNVWAIKEEWVGREEEIWETNAEGAKVCIQPFVEGKLKRTPIPPKPTTSKFGMITNKPTPPPPPSIPPPLTPQEAKKIEYANDPVFLLLEKSKKTSADIEVILTITLPPKSLYNMIKESFDEGSEKTIKYIVDNMDVEQLKSMIGQAVSGMYETVEQE
jgi:hypothetical protein